MTEEVEPETPAKPKKKGKRKLILMLLVLILAGGGAGGAYALGLFGSKKASAETVSGPKLVTKDEQKRGGEGDGKGGEAAAKGGAKAPSGSAVYKYASNYYSLDMDFTSNLQYSVHYVLVVIAVRRRTT